MPKETLGDATVDAIAALAQQALQDGYREVRTGDGRHLLVLPTVRPDGRRDYIVQDVTDPLLRPLPFEIRQVLTLQTLDSLVSYAERFKGPNTALFADISANSITAMIDYHGPASPDHVAHRATMTLPFSVEWQTWAAIDGKYQEQLAFARFLEENAADIVAPGGADLLEVCRDLQAKRTVDFRKAVRTNTDNESFEFTDETTAKSRATGEAIEVPSKFQMSIPIYFGGEYSTLYAFLRWRLDDGKLLLGVKLHRAEHVRQAVFKQIVADAAARIDREAVFGRLGS